MDIFWLQKKRRRRKKKEDPKMEDKVYEWLLEQYNKKFQVTRNQIREVAFQQSSNQQKFKASKGWLDKFMSRYKCKYMLHSLKNDKQKNKENESYFQKNQQC
ncbi:hypothetical protein IMG5_107560 [Ichthyophthirius multifiliis]|uniref:HTH CENPB-type domain-containing protein n=1 Tax=Ichthyophthirius multifiliis TaxID=5932 RepID=G0QTA1_ICHMU|nr:hypothetical protein IMG5_107560 [Ichthyophthirius multifiliis]EGR31536.1 hypothetical protein IMG5_107560 [Ichthyophthirius multifiliis]|eukprot:XP_004035022.1 hypothetical protein IMG5_107560 [Ichthyophthirius multifiliis]